MTDIAGPPLDVRKLVTVLAEFQVDYVIVGGIGALIHGATRATKDADIVVNDTIPNLQNLARALHELRARARVDSESVDYKNAKHAPNKRGRHIDDLEGAFLSVQTDAGPVDVMPSLKSRTGRLRYVDLLPQARSVAYSGQETTIIKVASLAHIIESKQLAARPKDHQALPELLELLNTKNPRTTRPDHDTGPTL